MSATIYDVSQLAGVSTATVSRTFSNPDSVREDTRRRVFEAADMLHYYPNAIARAMATQRTDKIAFLICKKDATILDEFYAGICEGIMKKANQYDYQLLISTAEDWKQAEGTSRSKQIEGVILGGDAGAELVSELQSMNIAVVTANNRMPGFDIPSVVSDEAGGVRAAVEHLISRGHRRIAMVAGRLSPYIVRERYNAFVEVTKEHGLTGADAEVRMCDVSIESATRVATELLTQKDRPTAVFGSNDMIAAGIIKAARKLDMKLPGELAVVGFDDASVCSMLEPELTSVRVNCEKIGEVCVDRLKSVLDGRRDYPAVTVIDSELRVRESS